MRSIAANTTNLFSPIHCMRGYVIGQCLSICESVTKSNVFFSIFMRLERENRRLLTSHCSFGTQIYTTRCVHTFDDVSDSTGWCTIGCNICMGGFSHFHDANSCGGQAIVFH